MARMLAFGDSWTIGDCTDLINENIIVSDHTVTDFELFNCKVFKTPWPNIVADRLGIPINNFGISGNCNKAIITQLYDYQLFHGFNDKDIVLVLLSTWHRSYSWKENTEFKYNKIISEHSSANYGPAHLSRPGHLEIDNVNKNAYDAFFDFYTIKNYLENIGVRYYIGWAFTQLSDFTESLSSEYSEEILLTKNLLHPFINFCKIVNPAKLLHPTLEDHINYANYVYERIVKDRL